jgi:hypothetical protein
LLLFQAARSCSHSLKRPCSSPLPSHHSSRASQQRCSQHLQREQHLWLEITSLSLSLTRPVAQWYGSCQASVMLRVKSVWCSMALAWRLGRR